MTKYVPADFQDMLNRIKALEGSSNVPATYDGKIAVYIGWSGLNAVWGGGQSLMNEPSLQYPTHIIGPAVQPTSESDGTCIPMWGNNAANMQYLVDAAHNAGKKAILQVYLGDPTTGGIDIEALDTNSQISTMVASIIDLVDTYGYDGADLDPEQNIAAGTYANIQAITGDVIDGLYAEWAGAKSISLAGQVGKYWPDLDPADETHVDWISLMLYDICSPNFPATADAHAAYQHATLSACQALTLKWLGDASQSSIGSANFGFTAAKLLMGIPAYAHYSTSLADSSNAGTRNYVTIVTDINPAANVDEAQITIGGVARNVYWNGPTMAATKAVWADTTKSLGGVMMYDLGQDKLNDSRSIIQAIYNALNP